MKVRIKSGAFGYRPKGSRVVELIYKGQICEVDDDQAKRLIESGAAELVDDVPAETTAPEEAEEAETVAAEEAEETETDAAEEAEPVAPAKKKASKPKKTDDKMPDLTVEDPV